MFKYYLVIAVATLISCEKKETAVIEKTVDSYKAVIEKAKETEKTLQKQADSLLKLSDSLSIP